MMTTTAQRFTAIALALLCACSAAAFGETPAKGDRILGIAVNESPSVDFGEALRQARRAGVELVSLPMAWDQIETGIGRYEPQPNYLAIANSYYPGTGLRVALEINPIDTNKLRTPEYLRDRSFDDPVVIGAFRHLLDYVLAQVTEVDLLSITIGNEVDAWLSDDADRESYRRFFAATAAYVRSQRPGVAVGVKVMFAGLSGSDNRWARALNDHSDVVMATYYALSDDFRVKTIDAVNDDLKRLVEAYPNKPIYLAEIGMPSGRDVGSSEKLQAAFITHVFEQWDRYADHIKLMEFTWLHDQDAASVKAFTAYYGLSDRRFIDFLATLGLRTIRGKDKPAFAALVRESKRRGW